MKPIVVIIGRPNVGKSTFFNRVTRTKDALVDNSPGVTRDRHFGLARWDDIEFNLVDTGGIAGIDEFSERITIQVHLAIEEADVIIFMLDSREGISPFDYEIASLLRPVAKPVFFCINKIDGPEQEDRLSEFYGLGVNNLYPLSAEHRYGLNNLMDDLVKALPSFSSIIKEDDISEPIRIAVVGRPNVGKSSLINKILGEERLLVSDIPGTTRDAVDTLCRIKDRQYLLIDTAGIRRKGKVSRKLEKFSIIKALRSLERCEVALVTIDAFDGITDQDITIAGYAHDRGCGCIFLLNKWDLIEKDRNTHKQYIQALREKAKFLNYAPALTISALTGQRVAKIFSVVDTVHYQYCTRVGTGKVNRIFETAVEQNTPSLHRGRRIKFFYATQISIKPPTFVCFVNYPDAIHFSYQRYLVNCLRKELGLDKSPIRLFFRKRERRGGPGRRRR
jgi:GTP-binding protein